ncbi:MAG TPA: PAS domain S-box protein [Gemmatimonadaceae bacterium]
MSNPTDLDSEVAGDHGTGSERQDQKDRPREPALDFWAVFESAPDSYLLLAPDAPRFTMLAANEARLRATRTRHEDVIGRPFFEIFPDNPEDPQATGVRNLRASLDEVLRTRKPQRMAVQKYDLRSAAGEFEERYWEPLNSPVFDDDGRLVYIIHRVEDVTARVRASRRVKSLESEAEETARRLTHETEARESVEAVLSKLRASEERYRLLADMIPQNVWTADATGHHTYFSRRWYDFTGATPEESHGEAWVQLLHPDDRERMREAWEHSLATGNPYEIEYRILGADGEYRWFLGKAMPRRNEAGEIVEWFGTTTDITERKRYEEERERLLEREREARLESERRREQLERVTESRARLMRGFSHDVKNPLGAADGFAALLEEGIGGELSEQQEKSVKRIRRSISTSLRLIGDLLELARAEAGQIAIDRMPTDVGATAREVAEDFRAQTTAAGIAMERHAQPGMVADTDPMRLRQILANVLSNAVKYAPNSTVTVDTAIRPSGGPGPGPWITASVSDTGPGIPKEKRESIFQEFTRLDPNAQSGAGVGLAISRRIAQLLGGNLTVESEVGRGSTFTLWLPPVKRGDVAPTNDQ